MQLEKTRAIIISSMDFRERDKIITFYTRDFGKISGVLHGAKSSKGRHGLNIEPLTLVLLLFQDKASSDLATIKECSVIKAYKNIRNDLEKLSNGLYCADLVKSLTPFRDKSIAIYNLLTQALKLIDTVENIETQVRVFEAMLLELLGFRPDVDRCVVCNGEEDSFLSAFSPSRGGLICGKCQRSEEYYIILPSDAVGFLRKIYLGKPDSSGWGNLSLKASRSLRRAFLKFIEYHFEKQIKSAEFLKQMEEVSG